jgi:hypothetical protein
MGYRNRAIASLDPYHIFHEKVGIFTDPQGNQLAFSGSNNESLSGWESNVESFHVYCSWEGGRDSERVNEELFRFEQLWNNLAPNVRVFDVPEAVQEKAAALHSSNQTHLEQTSGIRHQNPAEKWGEGDREAIAPRSGSVSLPNT